MGPMRVLLPLPDRDFNYASARWPGDAYLFARRLRDLLRDQELRMVTAAVG
jgi:hypothetical protein